MKARNFSRKPRRVRSAWPRWRVRPALVAGHVGPLQPEGNLGACLFPLFEPGTDHDWLDDLHDLVAVGVVRAELRALGRIQAALEQGAQDRGIDLRPVRARRLSGSFRSRRVSAPRRPSLSKRPPLNHATVSKPMRPPAAMAPKSSRAMAAKSSGRRRACSNMRVNRSLGSRADVFGEHAEDEAVDEMGDLLRVVAAGPQGLRQRGEGGSGALGQGLAALTGTQPLRIRHGPLEFVTHGGVGQIFKRELVNDADAVGPVGVNAEARHVGDDQQGRVFQRQGVLAQLVEGGVQVFVLALVLPGEAVPSPDIGPTAAAGVLAGAALKAVALPARDRPPRASARPTTGRGR